METMSCTITGHRPTRFKWKYNERDEGCQRLKRRLRDQLICAYEQGVHRFYTGGALGVDLWAGEILVRLKEQPEFAEIELMIALPFEGYNVEWDKHSRSRMDFLIKHSQETVVVGERGQPPTACYRKRNEYMVNRSQYLIAVFDQEKNRRSGTQQTVNFAKKKLLRIIYIHPDTAAVTGFQLSGGSPMLGME